MKMVLRTRTIVRSLWEYDNNEDTELTNIERKKGSWHARRFVNNTVRYKHLHQPALEDLEPL